MFDKLDNATPEAIKALNEKLGFTIPTQYESFLLTHGGGQPMNNFYRKYKDDKALWEFPVNDFFGLDNSGSDLFSVYCQYLGRIPKNLLPIGNDGIDNIICIGVNDNTMGKIFICIHIDAIGEERFRVEFLADSFEEFLSGLGED